VAALQRFANVTIERGSDGYRVGPWLRAVAGVSPTELARRVQRSRSSVSRWLSGAAQPRLPDFLLLVDAASGRVQDLVSELVPMEAVPILRERYETSLAARRLAFDAPWTEALLRLLETRAYHTRKHDGGWLARVLGLEPAHVTRCLSLLDAAGLVRFDGQRYVNVGGSSVDTRGGKQALHALKAHWADVAATRTRTPAPGDLHAYNVLSVSGDDLQRIHELLSETYREVRTIVAASQPSEQVALVSIHLLKWPTDIS
jgi:hypothetical protein